MSVVVACPTCVPYHQLNSVFTPIRIPSNANPFMRTSKRRVFDHALANQVLPTKDDAVQVNRVA